MTGNITVAKSWNELNDWQLQEISHLYLNTPVEKFHEAYVKMILLVYQQENTGRALFNLHKLTQNVPISELEKHTRYLKEKTDFYKFPEIPGLIKPTDRIGNISVRQFSTIDTFFHHWNKERSLINLQRLVASLYRIKEKYDDLDLAAVHEITKNIPVKQMESIALAFLFTRHLIANDFPVVFPKPKQKSEEEKKIKPVFTKKDQQFIPFDKIIIGMSMDELQPLGKKQDVNEVRIYEFLSVLSESILYHKAKANEGK